MRVAAHCQKERSAVGGEVQVQILLRPIRWDLELAAVLGQIIGSNLNSAGPQIVTGGRQRFFLSNRPFHVKSLFGYNGSHVLTF